MRQAAAILTFAGFFMWIQPLGAFIAPSAEDTACGGRRAVHMCSVQFTEMLGTAPAKASSQKTHLTASSSVSVEKTGSSASSSAFLDLALAASAQDAAVRRLADVTLALPAQMFFSPASPVPKR
jgi:hypothetical protein